MPTRTRDEFLYTNEALSGAKANPARVLWQKLTRPGSRIDEPGLFTTFMKMTMISLAMALVAVMVGCNAPASHHASRSGTASPWLYQSQFVTIPDSDERFWWSIEPDRTKLHYEPCSGSYDIAIMSETPSRLVFKVVRGYGRLRDLRDGRVVNEEAVVGRTFEVKLVKGKVISTQEQK